ncbi:MAG: hypothetical protein E6J20_20560 [Chloroflexi bacterium]|nr:MAG: hypothetical protein E6J20_20560 [Chloroflexota bacterium]
MSAAPSRAELDGRLARTAHLGIATKGFRRASSYRKKQIEWCWPGRLALGMATIIDSDPSRGTSQLFAGWAGHITTGRAWPDGAPCPKGGFVYIAGEDAIEEVCIPRFEAQGADLDRIIITSTKQDGTPIRLPEDVPYLEQLVLEVDARALVFDPIMTVLTGLTNPNSDKDVRQALTPLNEVLIRNRCFGAFRRHFNKNDKTSQALYRGMASVAFGALARTGFAVAKDPDSPGGFVFAPTKNNLARFPPALKYRIVDVDLGDGFHTSRIEWQGESQRTADELVTAFGGEQSKTVEAEQLLRHWLEKGPVLSDRLLDLAKEAGISFATYRRVKEDVLRCKAGQHKGRWYAFLPGHEQAWEQLRTQAEVVAEWNGDLSSGAHPPRSDAQMLIGGLLSDLSGAHSPITPFEHLILETSISQEPDAHAHDYARARAREDGALFDETYLDAVGSEMDDEAREQSERAELEELA